MRAPRSVADRRIIRSPKFPRGPWPGCLLIRRASDKLVSVETSEMLGPRDDRLAVCSADWKLAIPIAGRRASASRYGERVASSLALETADASHAGFYIRDTNWAAVIGNCCSTLAPCLSLLTPCPMISFAAELARRRWFISRIREFLRRPVCRADGLVWESGVALVFEGSDSSSVYHLVDVGID